MKFYEMLSEHYTEIFPLSGDLVKMVRELTPDGGTVADIGSARGELLDSLRESGLRTFGLEYEPALVGKKGYVAAGDMHCLPFESESFDTLVCTGNTLAHTDGPDGLGRIMHEFSRVLSCGGAAVLQVLNYDMILKSRPFELPVIKTERVRFEREYTYCGRRIKFTGRLTADGITESSDVMLYPLVYDELRLSAENKGFFLEEVYAGFDKTPFSSKNSFPLVVILRKLC